MPLQNSKICNYMFWVWSYAYLKYLRMQKGAAPSELKTVSYIRLTVIVILRYCTRLCTSQNLAKTVIIVVYMLRFSI